MFASSKFNSAKTKDKTQYYSSIYIGAPDSQFAVQDPETQENYLFDSQPSLIGNKFYRKVHNSHQSSLINEDNYVDHEYPITDEEIEDLDLAGGKCILKRLAHLYPKKYRFSFFPTSGTPGNRLDQEKGIVCSKKFDPLPEDSLHFLSEINLFSVEHYKSLFITQDYQEQGRYLLIVNYEGRCQIEVVDDYIPVYSQTLEPVWTRNLQNPWLMIMIKMWAKLKGGYHELVNAKPMEFISTFSNPHWRYFNLAKQPNFLNSFKGVAQAKIILRSKNNQQIQKHGLAPNELAYEILDVATTDQTNKKKKNQSKQDLLVLIRSTLPCSWKAQIKDIKQISKNKLGKRYYQADLKHTFIMPASNFYDYFASAYVTSDRKYAVSNYHIINVPPNHNKAIHLKFTLKKNGFLDYSFQQPSGNKRKANNASDLQSKRNTQSGQYLHGQQAERYQKCKYMLIWTNVNDSDISSSYGGEYQKLPDTEEPSFSKWRQQFENDYELLNYYCVESEYLKGYRQSEGHFINLAKGDYIIRFRPQTSPRETYYILNYSSNQSILIKQHYPNQEEKSQILRQSLASLTHKVNHITLQKNVKNQIIAFANQSQSIGYSFVSVCSKKKNNKLIKLEVAPKLIRQSGYKLKYPFKGLQEAFSILISPGKSSALIFKQLPGLPEYRWPPNGVRVLKK